MESMECPYGGCIEENDVAIQQDSHVILATSNKLLDIKSKFYRSGDDLIETNI